MATRRQQNSGEESIEDLVKSHRDLGTRLRQYALRSRQTAKTQEPPTRSALKVSAPVRPKPKKKPAPAPTPAPKKVARGKVPEHLRPFLFKKQQNPRGK